MLLFAIIILTVFMILDCLALVLLVLMQLPKKEAGAGMAFGGAATDALFGAGSGNFLTKATKYAGVIFFLLAVVLSLLQTHRAHQPGSDFLERVQQQNLTSQPAITAPPAPATTPATAAGTNLIIAPPSMNAPTNPMVISVPSNAAPAAAVPQK